jgi:hypothetical protein
MTPSERAKLQTAWEKALLVVSALRERERFANLRKLIERAYEAGCDRKVPLTLVLVASPTGMTPQSDVLIFRYDSTRSSLGPGTFQDIIGGTARGPIHPPI